MRRRALLTCASAAVLLAITSASAAQEIGQGLGLTLIRRAGAGAPALVVMGATPTIDPSLVADAGLGVGINGNGWVAQLTIPYLGTTTFDPTKITINVSDPGFDSSSTTTRTRALTGGAIIRRQYPNNATLLSTHIGSNLVVYFSLSDEIYAGTTITSVSAASGYYSTAPAGGLTSKNSSSLAYRKPVFAWLNLQHERATGTFNVEGVAYAKTAMLGRQVARIEYTASDQHANTSAIQVSATPALSAFQTAGHIVETYKAAIPVTALTQGDLCQVNARVFPWLGDNSAVLDLAVGGLAWPTANPQTKLRFLNDKTGAYGGAIAYVKAAGGGTPQVSKTQATAAAHPYATIDAALTAIVAFNNANDAHNDHSGSTIYLMDNAGAAQAHSPSTSGQAAGQCWTDIRVDPAATGAVSVSLSGTTALPDKLRWFVNITTGDHWFDGGNSNGNVMAAVESCTVDHTGAGTNVPMFYRSGLSYQRNVTHANLGANSITASVQAFGTERTQTALMLGCNLESTSRTAGSGLQIASFFAFIGNAVANQGLADNDLSVFTNWDSIDGGVVANNTFRWQRVSQSPLAVQSITRGFAFVQNVVERFAVAGPNAVGISADGAVNPIDNVLLHHNTIVGDRINLDYNDVAGSVGVIKNSFLKYNLVGTDTYNSKADVFTNNTTVSGRVGTFRGRYTCGHKNNVIAGGSLQGASPALDGSSWLGEVWQDVTYNVGAGNITWTSNLSGTGGAGGGTYTLTGGSNAAYNRTPSGLGVLAFDLAGSARPDDGTESAGAYR